ncbi:Hypothetical predicted protein [Mytilus galloprovincialis]|uniref:Beta-lactamase-related domain-containing protein n=1 Tax=Mytilus galloprovincialis TaxID=29158 RepID=A0A8B6BY44_MYTGA|nr:Hypothetical predicted protein [Mytilus galloprovincialis]
MSPHNIIALILVTVIKSCNGFSANEEDSIKSYIKTTMECKNITGLSLAMVRNGEVFTDGFGYSNIDTQTPVTSTTKMNIGSVTKTLTSMMWAVLISEAKDKNDTSIDWNTKVKDIFGPNFRLNDSCKASFVSLEDFLSHRTGLESADLLLQAGEGGHRSREDLLNNLKELESKEEFRDVFSYSNIGFVMVAFLAEKIGKKPWETLMREKLFEPLDMTSTLFLTDQTFSELATPYLFDEENGMEESDKSIYTVIDLFGPAGSVCSTADDMSNLLKYLTSGAYMDQLDIDDDVFNGMFKQKSILPKSFSSRYNLEYPQFPISFDTYGYGMAWFLTKYRGLDMYFHTGGLYGFTSVLGFIPSENISVFLNSNGIGKSGFRNIMLPTMYFIVDTLLELEPWLNETTACSYPSPWNTVPEKNTTARNKTQINVSETDRFIGNYSNSLYGHATVSVINETLTLQYGRLLHGTLSHLSLNIFNLTILEPLNKVLSTYMIVTFESFHDEQFQRLRFDIHPIFDRVSPNVNRANDVGFSFLLCMILVLNGLVLV